MARRTKIIATIGPSSSDPTVLRRMIDAGMDVARIGLAHGSLSEAIERYRLIRQVAAESGRVVGVLVDLPGPKVRLGRFDESGVDLVPGSTIQLCPGDGPSSATTLSVDYESLLVDVHPGDVLQIGDGAARMRIVSVDGDAAKAEITHGGRVRGRPGLHIPSDRLRLATPTAEDLYKLDAFVDEGVDMVAVSFVRSAHDIRRIGTEPSPRGPLIVAKIETRSAVENLAGIIEVSGAIMVARGDLGMEMGIEDLPHLQKRIIRDCIAFGRPVITATQMLESMITAPAPTRAEVSDVANAIFDGSSAVMLSAETAASVDPVNAVATMARISERADAEFDYAGWAQRVRTIREGAAGDGASQITDAMTGAAARSASDLGATAIIGISESGFTVRSIARFRPQMPILGFSPNERTVRQLTLSWGTTPLAAPPAADSLQMMDSLVVAARDQGYVRSGDLVAVLAGAGSSGIRNSTDLLRLVRVP